jgi:hypothetical protein
MASGQRIYQLEKSNLIQNILKEFINTTEFSETVMKKYSISLVALNILHFSTRNLKVPKRNNYRLGGIYGEKQNYSDNRWSRASRAGVCQSCP